MSLACYEISSLILSKKPIYQSISGIGIYVDVLKMHYIEYFLDNVSYSLLIIS